MTKQQLYDSIVRSGIQLAPIDSYTFKQLAEIAAPYHKAKSAPPKAAEPAAAPASDKIPLLFFPVSGWCAELGKSYTQGYYSARSRCEYDILRKYAGPLP